VVALRREADRDRRTCRGEDRGVLEELTDHERDLDAVDGCLHLVLRVHLDGMVAGLRGVRGTPHDHPEILHADVESEGSGVQLQCEGHLLDGALEPFRLVPDQLEELPPLAVVEPVVVGERGTREAADRRHRTPDLVRELRDEGGPLREGVACDLPAVVGHARESKEERRRERNGVEGGTASREERP
jgi:hypothetical protein